MAWICQSPSATRSSLKTTRGFLLIWALCPGSAPDSKAGERAPVECKVGILLGRRRGAAFKIGAEPQHGFEALMVESGIPGQAANRIGARRIDFSGDLGRDVEPLANEPDCAALIRRLENPAQPFDAARQIADQRVGVGGRP